MLDFSDVIEDIKQEVINARKEVVSDFMEYITKPYPEGSTPVDTGQLMANTFVTDNLSDNSTTQQTDKYGDDTYTRAMLKLSTIPFDRPVYIVNNLDYAVNAESAGWARTEPYYFFSNAYTYAVSEL